MIRSDSRMVRRFDLYLDHCISDVNDILLAIPRLKIDHIINVFNSYHPRLKFTAELEVNRSINFLDTTIQIVNNELILNWYHKPIFSSRYLNFLSQHSFKQKIGVIYCILDWAILLSHPRFYERNLTLAIEILLANNYPLDLIFKQFNKRLYYLFNNKLNTTDGETIPLINPLTEEEKKFLLPYIPHLTIGLVKSLRNINYNFFLEC